MNKLIIWEWRLCEKALFFWGSHGSLPDRHAEEINDLKILFFPLFGSGSTETLQ
ncbi:MAG: hypothetical protein LBG96_13320 [Tannerella sp.]|nr:hypothetical protein [Tannerella sp.]